MGLTSFLTKAGILVEDKDKKETSSPSDSSTTSNKQSTEKGEFTGNASTAPSVQSSSTLVYIPNVGSVDESLLRQIFQIFETDKLNRKSKIDYLDFKKALDKLKSNSSVSSHDRYKTIFDILSSTSDLTIDILLTSIDNYISILNNEKEEFEKEVNTASIDKVATLDKSIATKQENILSIEKQIESLKANIQSESSGIVLLQNEKTELNNKIQLTVSKFYSTVNHIQNELNNDQTTIKTLLQ